MLLGVHPIFLIPRTDECACVPAFHSETFCELAHVVMRHGEAAYKLFAEVDVNGDGKLELPEMARVVAPHDEVFFCLIVRSAPATTKNTKLVTLSPKYVYL